MPKEVLAEQTPEVQPVLAAVAADLELMDIQETPGLLELMGGRQVQAAMAALSILLLKIVSSKLKVRLLDLAEVMQEMVEQAVIHIAHLVLFPEMVAMAVPAELVGPV
ncbi:hypothetical protein MmiAt1_01620 [Methanimicrococcus sp. At1]|uniref:Uncharacterized protein n=1 Tax=Methanimicrococcus hacksteinii TaxID=3028293 RepID=A0ABU3VMJ6_9EURY|nr:hypothetical protein [Methanimicrococcus sp. At1]